MSVLPNKENHCKYVIGVIGGRMRPVAKSVIDIENNEIKTGRKLSPIFDTYDDCIEYINKKESKKND